MTTVLLAHGSPDARHARALERLRERVCGPLLAAGHGPTVLAYIEHDAPSPAELGRWLSGQVTLVPMLITPAFHARVDVPAAARHLASLGASVRSAAALGGHDLLLAAVEERIRGAGHDPGAPTLLVAGGSSSGEAAASLSRLVATGARPTWATTTLNAPRLGAAVGRTVVPLVLAEGVLHDKVAAYADEGGSPFVRGGLAETRAVADLVLQRVLT
ncbi:sirohydrochlorin chelatase [Janibacter cremeus]|uniref:Sirohydrochlorin ferrochelatase n=1 Tax=Janibacter cremeus TaxID=1285192 RepID=A0A852VRM3_9MICO|nr:CbiX/SirB N-terminal domain-containing protein [Janibacter cremeus]NYF99657.1 sirohydrochlorin ferrochelatase [Janibacter cremeus]